jgi:hypothetical protein
MGERRVRVVLPARSRWSGLPIGRADGGAVRTRVDDLLPPRDKHARGLLAAPDALTQIILFILFILS